MNACCGVFDPDRCRFAANDDELFYSAAAAEGRAYGVEFSGWEWRLTSGDDGYVAAWNVKYSVGLA